MGVAGGVHVCFRRTMVDLMKNGAGLYVLDTVFKGNKSANFISPMVSPNDIQVGLDIITRCDMKRKFLLKFFLHTHVLIQHPVFIILLQYFRVLCEILYPYFEISMCMSSFDR